MKPNVQAAAGADLTDEEARRELRRISRRGFAVAGAAAFGAVAGLRWLATALPEEELSWPLRRVLRFNERIARGAFRASSRTPEFPAARAEMPIVNGINGLEFDLDPVTWRLRVEGPGGSRRLTLADLAALPRVEHVTALNCVEGWSTVVRWSGWRLVDLAEWTGFATRSGTRPDRRFGASDLVEYVAAECPGAGYYVGLDTPSALHDQTLLCDRMNGIPLDAYHGAPLRLVVPAKYGFKSLKCLGTIRFTNDRPRDYWAEMGYDWYAGL